MLHVLSQTNAFVSPIAEYKMSTRVKCVGCEREIQETTAAKNKGLCSPCVKAPDELRGQALLSFFATGGFVVVGILAFLWFRSMETNGGQIRTHALIVLAYGMLGSLGVLALFLLFAAGALANGIWKRLSAGKKQAEIEGLQRRTA
jgi:hypothetical protein